MRTLPTPPLLVVTDRHQLAGGQRAIKALAEAAFRGGARWVSLREKDLGMDEQVALARDLVRCAAPFGARVSVHGSAEVARLAGADGVHLPEHADATAARALLGEHALIGQSVHSPEQARAADPDIVDYLIAGPAFITASKPGYGPALGAAGLADIVKAARMPVIAIGGINAAAVPICLQAGAAGIAVMGAIMSRADPSPLVRALVTSFETVVPGGE